MLGALGIGLGRTDRQWESGALCGNDFITPQIAGGKHAVIGQLMKLGRRDQGR